MNKDVKEHYEGYWSKPESDTFCSYERNLVLAQLFRSQERILDVGCGDGAVGEHLIKNLDAKVDGIDISLKAVEVARRRGINAKVWDLENSLPFKTNTFDAVFWGDNIEHLFKPAEVLDEIRRVLKKNGRLIMSCPNMGYWRYRLYYLFNGCPADTEWSGSLPWDWGHIRFFNKRILEKFLSLKGFKINKFIGVSRRRLDKPFLEIFPTLFGMIMVVEAK